MGEYYLTRFSNGDFRLAFGFQRNSLRFVDWGRRFFVRHRPFDFNFFTLRGHGTPYRATGNRRNHHVTPRQRAALGISQQYEGIRYYLDNVHAFQLRVTQGYRDVHSLYSRSLRTLHGTNRRTETTRPSRGHLLPFKRGVRALIAKDVR